ncbi:hypothetical protein BH10PSE14_BH10PSE14_22230 [soil metagenome]
MNNDPNTNGEDLDDAMTDLMQAHLDDVTGALGSKHSSWKQNNYAAPTAE